MHQFLNDLRKKLDRICPTFLQIPHEAPYPYITLEPQQHLVGLPWGPRILLLDIKIWSRYKGTQEILRLTSKVESSLLDSTSFKVSLSIVQSTLGLLTDGQTRKHTFRLKVRLRGNADE